MKKYFALCLLAVLSACDDGDLTYENLDFEDGQVLSCGSSNATVLYKIADDQAFLINLPNLNTGQTGDLPDVPGTTIIPITGEVRVVYRHYTGTIVADNLCDAIPPSTPVVDEEWTAVSGNIVITSTVVKSTNADTDPSFPGGETLETLSHEIKLEGVTFNTPSDPQVYNVYRIGVFEESLDNPPLPEGNPALEWCPEQTALFERSGATLFTVVPAAWLLDPTVLNEPKTGYIGTDATVTFSTYPEGSGLDNLLIPDACTALFAFPSSQVWTGVNGSAETATGIVEVTTIDDVPGVVKHIVRLKNVTLERDGFSFLIATDYLLGEILVNI